MADLQISPEAEADLDGIWLYIAKESRSIERADRFLDRFATFFSRLVRNPYLGRRRDDLRPGYRSFGLSDYLVFYRLTEAEDILVLRAVQGSRNLEDLFV